MEPASATSVYSERVINIGMQSWSCEYLPRRRGGDPKISDREMDSDGKAGERKQEGF